MKTWMIKRYISLYLSQLKTISRAESVSFQVISKYKTKLWNIIQGIGMYCFSWMNQQISLSLDGSLLHTPLDKQSSVISFWILRFRLIDDAPQNIHVFCLKDVNIISKWVYRG